MIEISLNNDMTSTSNKAILIYAGKHMVETKSYQIESHRNRRHRGGEKSDYIELWNIPYGISNIKYKDYDFKIKYVKVGDPVGNDLTQSIIHKELYIMIDETKYPNFKEIINNFIKDARDYYKSNINDQIVEKEKISCYMWDEYWDDIYRRKKRALSTVHLNKDSDKVLNDMQRFLSKETEELYELLGVPYKRNYLFEGYPGTGKTSLIWSLASELDMNVAILNFSSEIDDVKFTRAMLRIPKDTILVLEDIDVLFNENRKKNDENKNMITLSGLLNTLDGLAHQQKQIIVMTTNFKCTLDNALQRPGRIDYILHFDFANKNQIKAMFEKFLPKQKDKFNEFYKIIKKLDITTATLQQFLFQHIYDENILEYMDEFNKLVEDIDYSGKKLNMYS